MQRVPTGLLVLLLAVACPHTARAQQPSPAPSSSAGPVQISTSTYHVPPEVLKRVEAALRGPDHRGKDGPLSTIGRELATLYYQHEARGPSGVRRLSGVGAQVRPTSRAVHHSPVSPSGRRVAVNAIATTTPEALLNDLRGLGLEGGATAGTVVSGRLPISALKDAARLSSLRGALPAYARTHVADVEAGADSVQSEADTAHAAPQGRTDLGVDGSGQTICALSDSYDRNGSAATSADDDVSTGDLPGPDSPDGNTTAVDTLDDGAPGSDEGRAMLQLIHDIAPGAALGFHTAAGGLGVFAQGIRDLADAGCTVIVDDIGYNIQPFYQDGPVSNAVDDVVSNDDVAYFSSAGNDGQNSYEAPFRDSGHSGVLSDTSVAHDFAPGTAVDTLQKITIRKGGDFGFFTFQWTDPSSVVAGSKGADTDLDVALVNDTLGVVAQSALDSDTSGFGVPFESLRFVNNGTVDTDDDGMADSTFHLAIEKAVGPDPDEVKYIYSGSDFTVEEYDTLGPTIYGHPMAEGAMAVAAAPFYYTAAYNSNTDPATLESFSSKGGIPILFDQSGNRLATPIQRQKPDVTGTDGVDNTFFGPDLPSDFFNGVDADPYPNFFGTSAAAPNVAAIAALIREANPGFAPSDVYVQLETNAEDITQRLRRDGTLAGIAEGGDPWSGHGFAQATGSALPVELARFDATTDGTAAVLTWRTASETSNAGFAVEHTRGDRDDWTELAYKEGARTTTAPRRYRYRTAALEPGTHTFRLRQMDLDGSSTYSREVTATVVPSGTHHVSAVAPNPVRGHGTVSIMVREAQAVRVVVYNTLGQRVSVLHDGPLPARDARIVAVGAALPSGVYFLRVEGESFTTTKKFVRVQ